MVTFWKWWSLRRNRSTVNLHLHESHETSRKSPNCKIVNKRLLLLSVVNLLGTTQWRRWRERFAVAYFLLSTNLLFPADTNSYKYIQIHDNQIKIHTNITNIWIVIVLVCDMSRLYFIFCLSQVESYQSEEPQESNCSGPAKFFCILLAFAFFCGQMQWKWRSRYYKYNVVVAAKPISVVGAARVCLMSLNCSKTWVGKTRTRIITEQSKEHIWLKQKKNKRKKQQKTRPEPYLSRNKDW